MRQTFVVSFSLSLFSKINGYICDCRNSWYSFVLYVRLMCILVNNRRQFVPQKKERAQSMYERVVRDLSLSRNSGFASRKSSNLWCGFTYVCVCVIFIHFECLHNDALFFSLDFFFVYLFVLQAKMERTHTHKKN